MSQALVAGDVVQVIREIPGSERYFSASDLWKVESLWDTNTRGFMAHLIIVGGEVQWRSVLTSNLVRVPPALR